MDENPPRISEMFTPRDQWQPDDQAHQCFSCQGSFDMWNRRHHCRMCGNVFHSKCSNNFVCPPLFYYEDEKNIRLCKPCFDKSQGYLRRGSITTKGLVLTNQLTLQKLMQLEKFIYSVLTKRMHDLCEEVLSFTLHQNGLSEDWYSLLRKITIDAAELVQPNTINVSGTDINNFIKIKKIMYPDKSLTKLVRGIVIRRNITHKKMRKEIEKPNILMIRGNLDQHKQNELTTLDSSSFNKEQEYLETLAKKIINVHPHVVMTDGVVNRIVQEALYNAGITLAMKVKDSQFQKVCRYVNAKPIENIESVLDIDSLIMGNCEKFEIKNYDNKVAYEEAKKYKPDENWDNFDPSLMIFDGCNAERGVTVLLSGPDFQELTRVKKSLRETFRILRSLVLERTIVHQEIFLHHTKERLWSLLANKNDQLVEISGVELKQKLSLENYIRELEETNEIIPSTCLLNESTFGSSGYIIDFLAERTSIEKLIMKNSFNFTRYVIVPMDFSMFPDLSNIAAPLKQKMEANLKASKRVHRDELCQIESMPQMMRIYYHDKDDISLGSYLYKELARVAERCQKCNRFCYFHTTLLYAKRCYIKITLELKDGPTSEFIKRESKKLNSKLKNTDPSVKKDREGFFEFLAGFTPTLKRDHLLTSASAYQRDITMYLECTTCKTKVSESIKLRKPFIDYPLTRYLENLIITANKNIDALIEMEGYKPDNPEWKIKELVERLPRRPNIKPCCLLSPKNRVFVVDDLIVRFRVGYANPFSFNFLTFHDEKSTMFVKKAYKQLIDKKKQRLYELQISYLSMILKNIKYIIKFLIDAGGFEITVEEREKLLTILTPSNPQTKDPYNQLLLNLIAFCDEIENLQKTCDQNLQKNYENHLEIDLMRKQFFEQIVEFASMLEDRREQYIELIEQEKKKVNTSNEVQANAENSDSPLARKETNSQKNKPKLDIPTTQEPEEDESDTEIKFVLKFIAGRSTYLEDLEYETYQKYRNMPVYEDQPLSAIAYSLNSPVYINKVYKAEKFLEMEKDYLENPDETRKNPTFVNFLKEKQINLESKPMKSVTITIPPNEINIKYFNNILLSLPDKDGESIIPNKSKKANNMNVIEDITGLIDIGGKAQPTQVFTEKFSTAKASVTIYYPVQFEAFRFKNDIHLGGFLESISCSLNWEDNSGGKTGASFMKTFDQKFVFKRLEKKEFTMLLGFCTDYFAYMWDVCENKKPSLLAKIFGIFEIQYEKRSPMYFIAMENLFFGIHPLPKVYDLKGSELNRFISKASEGNQTLLDTNYRVDRNGEPLPIKADNYDFIDKAIKNDSDFLSTLKVVDYSLLLLIDEERSFVRMGVIDYLRLYDFEKHLEHMGKKIIKGTTPTITTPEDYKERFQKAMKKYFMVVPNDFLKDVH